MACPLFRTQPLSQAMMAYGQFNPFEQYQLHSNQNMKFTRQKCFKNVVRKGYLFKHQCIKIYRYMSIVNSYTYIAPIAMLFARCEINRALYV